MLGIVTEGDKRTKPYSNFESHCHKERVSSLQRDSLTPNHSTWLTFQQDGNGTATNTNLANQGTSYFHHKSTFDVSSKSLKRYGDNISQPYIVLGLDNMSQDEAPSAGELSTGISTGLVD